MKLSKQLISQPHRQSSDREIMEKAIDSQIRYLLAEYAAIGQLPAKKRMEIRQRILSTARLDFPNNTKINL